MGQITVVIGDRLGKGQKSARALKTQAEKRWLSPAWRRI